MFAKAARLSAEGLLMTPRTTETDGFFVACCGAAAEPSGRVNAALDANSPFAPHSRPNFSAMIFVIWNALDTSRQRFPECWWPGAIRFHPGAHDAAYRPDRGAHAVRAPRLARTVTMLQVLGSLLAIPLGLASAYSIYRANFSPETTCQSLRANIVSMLDKSVDAAHPAHAGAPRRVTFEQNCGAVDPDATAAFKALLATDGAAAPPSRQRRSAARRSARRSKLVRKANRNLQASRQAERRSSRADCVPSAVAMTPLYPTRNGSMRFARHRWRGTSRSRRQLTRTRRSSR